MIEMEIGAIARDAREYGEHLRSGGARMGLLVARSVRSASRGRPIKGATAPFTKVTATRFAAMSGCDKNLIVRHLRAWDEYVQANRDDPRGLPGLLFSYELVPGQEIEIDASSLPERLRFGRFYSAQVRLANPQGDALTDAKVAARTRVEQRSAGHVRRRPTDLGLYRNVPGGMPREHREPIATNGFDILELEIWTAENSAQSAWTSWNELVRDGMPDQVPGDGRRPPGTFDSWRREVLGDMEVMMRSWADLRLTMEQYGSPLSIDLRDATSASPDG